MTRRGIAAAAALLLAACAAAPTPPNAARPSDWRIAVLADIDAASPQKAAAAAILAYFQDTAHGQRFAAGEDALCLGVGPASGGPFRFQQLDDLQPELLAHIARTRPNVRAVSECATTLKGAPYRLEATGEPARLLACLSSGEFAPGTVRLLCGFYDSAIDAEFIGYDVTLAADAITVRRNGRSLAA